MTRFMKKIAITIVSISFALLYVFSTNLASAAVGSKKVEKSYIYPCLFHMPFPGVDPFLVPSQMDFSVTVPERVGPGKEFFVNTSIKFHFPNGSNPSQEQPMITGVLGPNFKINSENETSTVHMFLDDTELISPPGHIGAVSGFLTGENGVEVGPFIAGEQGEVVLKVGEIRMNLLQETLTIGYDCPPPDEDLTIASIPIDHEAPVITLKGDNPVIVEQGDPYVEPGATATDNIDGDLTDQIEISGDVDTSKIGTYTVTYTVSDSVGNVTTVERTVNVVEPFGDFYSGEGPPNDSFGNNGDSYLDVTTGDVYKRDPNTWTKVGNIKGDDGKQGSKIHTGSGAPKADLGDVGDLYVDTKTGDVYEKTADGWVKVANLQGPAGPEGPQGPKGADGTGAGKKGDGASKDDGTSRSDGKQKSDGDGKGTAAKGGKLPKTATSLPAFILLGALLVVVGGVMFLRKRKALQ